LLPDSFSEKSMNNIFISSVHPIIKIPQSIPEPLPLFSCLICANEYIVLSKYMKDVLLKKYKKNINDQFISTEDAISQFKALTKLNTDIYQPKFYNIKYTYFILMKKQVQEKKSLGKNVTKASSHNIVPVELTNENFNMCVNHSFGNREITFDELSFSSDEHSVYSPRFDLENEITDKAFLSQLKNDSIKLKTPIPKILKKSQKSRLESSLYMQRNITNSFNKLGNKSNNLRFTESSTISSSITNKTIKLKLGNTNPSKKSSKYLLVKSLANSGLLKNSLVKRSESTINKTKKNLPEVEVVKCKGMATTHRKLSKSSLIVKNEVKHIVPLRLSNKAMIMGKALYDKDSFGSSRGIGEESTKRECKRGWETFRKLGSKKSVIGIGRTFFKRINNYNSNEDFTHKASNYIFN